jgi:hypothetical protein
MTTFAQQKAKLGEKPRPARIVTLEPSAWAHNAPKTKVALGLRPLAQTELMTSQAEAWKEAHANGREGEAAEERFNEALLCWVVGFATTDPNDASKPFFEFGNEQVREQLRPETIRRLWDELELAKAATSPLLPAATDEELAELGALLCGEAPLEGLDPAKALRVRRWARVLLEHLDAIELDPASPDPNHPARVPSSGTPAPVPSPGHPSRAPSP